MYILYEFGITVSIHVRFNSISGCLRGFSYVRHYDIRISYTIVADLVQFPVCRRFILAEL